MTSTTKAIMAAATAEVLAQWEGHPSFAWAGECGDFASFVRDIVIAKGISPTFDSFDTNLVCDTGFVPPPGISTDELQRLGVALNHIWLVVEGRHYDGANPEGASCLLDMHAVRVGLTLELKDKAPGVLEHLTEHHDWWRESLKLGTDFEALAAQRY